MLTLLQNANASTTERHRLDVAIAHIEAAISHINNEAQHHVPLRRAVPSREVDELRLIVCALADVVDALRSRRSARPRISGSE